MNLLRSPTYPDPDADNEKLVVFDLAPNRALENHVTLKQIKEDGRFDEFHLVKFTRLSVMPVTKEHWDFICDMGK